MMADPFTSAQLAAGETLFARQWRFVRGVPSLELLPPPDRLEMAFAGRSNVGKSSLLNALTGQSALARVSNTPGRTQDINYFEVPGRALYLADMPGYGFAKAPRAKIDAWVQLTESYLRGRPTLSRVFLLIDARRGLMKNDREVMGLLNDAAVSYQVILTKIDKVAPELLCELTGRVREELSQRAAAYPRIIATSAHTGAGIAELKAEIAELAVAHGVVGR